MKFNLKSIFILLGIIIGQMAFSQPVKPFFLGHSLVNFEIPNMVDRMAEFKNKNYEYKLNIGNGANLLWHYTNPFSPGSQGDIWVPTLTEGGFTHFIFTEAVPLKGHLQWSSTYQYADTLVTYFRNYNTPSKVYLYETWHCINSGNEIGCPWDNDDHIPWKDRLTSDFDLWKGIVDYLKNQGHEEVYMIPAGQGLYLLNQEIVDKQLPGISDIRNLFSDDIHLTNIGNYFIACMMYGIVFNESPEGSPHRLRNNWEILYDVYPSPEQALALQKIAWQVLCENEISGVNCITETIDEVAQSMKIVFKNNGIHTTSKVENLFAYTLDGKLVTQCNNCDFLPIPRNLSTTMIMGKSLDKGLVNSKLLLLDGR